MPVCRLHVKPTYRHSTKIKLCCDCIFIYVLLYFYIYKLFNFMSSVWKLPQFKCTKGNLNLYCPNIYLFLPALQLFSIITVFSLLTTTVAIIHNESSLLSRTVIWLGWSTSYYMCKSLFSMSSVNSTVIRLPMPRHLQIITSLLELCTRLLTSSLSSTPE
jgi:hypothetical protein